jgi:RNA polymerase sigma-70 factor, ECF subfamily
VRDLLEEYVPRVYGFALRLTHDRHAAEDLTQETMLRAWRKRGLLRKPQAARVWLFRIAVNLWRDQLRRGQSPVARAGPLEESQAADRPGPDQQVTDQDDLSRVLKEMDSLPQRQREVLYLSACEGLSACAIAEILAISPDAAKANLSLARKKLRQHLHDLFVDF